MAGSKNDVVVGKNADFSQAGAPNATTSESNGLATNGQLWIGSTAVNVGGTHVNVGTITSTTLTIGYSSPNITINAPGGGAIVEHLTGNTGGQLNPDGSNNFNIVTANTTVLVAGSGSTLTMDFEQTNLAFGTTLPSLTSGIANVIAGGGTTGQSITSGSLNVIVGHTSAPLLNTGINNVIIGANSALSMQNAAENVAVGPGVLAAYTSSANSRNIAIGSGSLSLLVNGTRNICLGVGSGATYTSSESLNINIANAGVLGESSVTRIGTNQVQCYLSGVLNSDAGRVVNVTVPVSYPYTTLISDHVIRVDTSSARTITPLANPVTGTTYRIKDNSGLAATNNITITPSGKNIDGSASYVIATNWGSVDIVYTGTQWNVL